MKHLAVTLTLALAAGPALAADYTVDQINQSFAPGTLKLKVGDHVDFRNSDPFFHNVFSLSEIASFDLGSYPKGQSRRVTFDKPGKIDVECAIHPDMRLAIEVAP